MSTLSDLMVSMGTELFYTEDFRQVLESHLSWLRDHPDTYAVQVTPELAYRHEGDLHGVLREQQQPRHYHWLIMRLSDLHHNAAVGPQHPPRLLIPASDAVDTIVKRYRTTKKT